MPDERLVPEMDFPSNNAATTYVRGVSGGNEPHHVGVILRGSTPDFSQQIYDRTGLDIRRLSFNLLQLPGTRAGQDALRVNGVSPSRHGRGGHLFSYGARQDNGFWEIVRDRIAGMSRTDAANYVVRAMGRVTHTHFVNTRCPAPY